MPQERKGDRPAGVKHGFRLLKRIDEFHSWRSRPGGIDAGAMCRGSPQKELRRVIDGRSVGLFNGNDEVAGVAEAARGYSNVLLVLEDDAMPGQRLDLFDDGVVRDGKWK